MDEDKLNMEIRKFLKVVGITSQREIEAAVRQALSAGKIKSDARLRPRMVLTISELGLEHHIDGKIALG